MTTRRSSSRPQCTTPSTPGATARRHERADRRPVEHPRLGAPAPQEQCGDLDVRKELGGVRIGERLCHESEARLLAWIVVPIVLRTRRDQPLVTARLETWA